MSRGWIAGKNQPKWHRVIFDIWSDMWDRVYSNINYFGKTIQPKYKYFSGYIEDIMKLENFDLFKENPKGWSIDKDIKGGTYVGYYFQYLSLVRKGDNTIDANSRRDYSKTNNPMHDPLVAKKFMKPIVGISNDDNSIIFFKSLKDAEDSGFKRSSICNVLKNRRKSHGGYRWFYLDWSDYLDNSRN